MSGFQKRSAFVVKVLFSKYSLVMAFFLVIIVFFDDHNLIKRHRMNREVKQLEVELKHYRSEIQKNSQEIHRLTTDTVYLEKIARENYLMKRDNEDIFIINELVP